MRRFFHRLRIPVLAALGAAWLVASNHCAIASLTGGHREKHSCCSDDKVPAQKPCAEKCCSALAAPVPAADAVPSPDTPLIAILPELAAGLAAHPVQTGVCGLSPPGAGLSFFVEFVAGTGLQPNAPPRVVA